MSIFAVTFYPSRKSDNHRGGIYWAVKLYTDTSSHLKSGIKIGKVSFKRAQCQASSCLSREMGQVQEPGGGMWLGS